ncbi:unnamed protein product, partial [Nesidiocoris tenuis]
LQDFQCPKSSPHYPSAPSDPLRLRMVPPGSHVEAPHASSSPFSAPPVKEARIDTSQSSKTDAIRLGEADSNGFVDERKLKTALRKTRSCVLHNCNEANNLDSGLTRGNTLLHRTLRSRSLYSDCSHSTARNSKVWKAERVKSSREKMDLPEASKLSTFHPKVRSRTSSTNSRLYPQTDSTATMLTKSNHNLLVENRPPNDQKPGLMKNTEHPNLGVQMKKRQSSSKTEAIEILSATPKKPFGRPRKASLEIKVNDGNVAKKSTNCSSTKEKMQFHLGMPKSSKLSTPVSGVESDDCLLPVKTEWPSSRCLSSNPDHQNDQMKGSTPAESIPEQANDSRVSRPRSSTNSSAAQTAPFLKKSVKRPHEQRLKPSKDAPKKPRGRPPKSTSLGSHQTSDQPHSWIPSITTSTPEQINGDMKETASKKVLEHHSKLRSKTGSTIKIGDSRINVKIEDSPRPNSSPLASDSNPDHWVNSSTSALPYQTNDIVEGSFDIVSPDGNSTPMKTENRLADSNIPKKPSGPTCKSASVRSSIEKFEISPIKMERPESSLVEPFGPVSDVVREQPSSATEYRRTLRPVKVEPDYLEESSSSSDTPSLSSQSPVHNVNSVRSKRNLSTSDEGQAGRRPSVDSTSAGRKLLSSDCGTKRIPSHPPKREKLVFFGPKNRRGRPRKVRLPSDEIQHACTSFKSQSDAKKLLTDDSRENLAPQCQEMAVQTDDVSFSLGNFFIIPDI